jgi:hypothetical protein
MRLTLSLVQDRYLVRVGWDLPPKLYRAKVEKSGFAAPSVLQDIALAASGVENL